MLSLIEWRQAPDFVPGLPHIVAHTRRYLVISLDMLATLCVDRRRYHFLTRTATCVASAIITSRPLIRTRITTCFHCRRRYLSPFSRKRTRQWLYHTGVWSFALGSMWQQVPTPS